MATCDNVFQRTEKKYRISAEQRAQIQNLLSSHMSPDGFGCSRVTSVYFDTPAHELIGRSMDKPLYKEKLRIRAYGDDAGDALVAAFDSGLGRARHAPVRSDIAVYVELKKKYAGVVYKRRFACSLPAAKAYVAGASYPEACAAYPLLDDEARAGAGGAVDLQVASEIGAMLGRYDALGASLGIECRRVAWAPDPDADRAWGDLRVTFDADLRYRDLSGFGKGGRRREARRGPAHSRNASALRRDEGRTGGRGADGDGEWVPIISPDESIMELKSSTPLPLELAEALAQMRVYPRSFSKCGAAWALLSQSTLKGGRCA